MAVELKAVEEVKEVAKKADGGEDRQQSERGGSDSRSDRANTIICTDWRTKILS